MQTDFLGNLGIDAGYLIVLLFMIQIFHKSLGLSQ